MALDIITIPNSMITEINIPKSTAKLDLIIDKLELFGGLLDMLD